MYRIMYAEKEGGKRRRKEGGEGGREGKEACTMLT